MASGITNRAKFNALKAMLEDVADLDMLLLKSTYVFDADDNFVSDVVALECGVAGYARKNVTMNATVEDDANNRADVDFQDVVFPATTNGETLSGAYLFNNAGGADTARELIAWIEFAATVNTGGDITVSSAANAVELS